MFCVYWSLIEFQNVRAREGLIIMGLISCLLYTSDAADEEDSVDLGGRRIIKIT